MARQNILPSGRDGRPVAVFVLDLADNGFWLTSSKDGVKFDIDGTGQARQVGWTARDSDDGFLFLDTNGNNVVDNGRELLGNGWRKEDGTRVVSGDEALSVIQGVFDRKPGKVPEERAHIIEIDQKDDVFARLRIWQDRNHNGVSEPVELQQLTDASVLRVYLGFNRFDRKPDAAGNVWLLDGTFYMRAGVRRMIEVEFGRAPLAVAAEPELSFALTCASGVCGAY